MEADGVSSDWGCIDLGSDASSAIPSEAESEPEDRVAQKRRGKGPAEKVKNDPEVVKKVPLQ